MAYRRLPGFHPDLIRRVIDDIANHSIAARDISNLLDVKFATIRSWCLIGKIKRGCRVTPQVLDKIVEKIKSSRVDKLEEDGIDISEIALASTEFRQLTEVQKEYIKNGFSETKPIVIHSDADKVMFAGMVATIDRQVAHLESSANKAENLQQITKLVSTALALKNLREAFINPPLITNWKDVKILVDMAREALDMNKKDDGGRRSNAVNVGVLSIIPKGRKPKKETVTLEADVLNDEIED